METLNDTTVNNQTQLRVCVCVCVCVVSLQTFTKTRFYIDQLMKMYVTRGLYELALYFP
jgi:hypothetical protein